MFHLLDSHLFCDFSGSLHFVQVCHHTRLVFSLHFGVIFIEVLLDFKVPVAHPLVERAKVRVDIFVFVPIILEVDLGLHSLLLALLALPDLDLLDVLLVLAGADLLHDADLLALGLPDQAAPLLVLLVLLLDLQGDLILKLLYLTLPGLFFGHYLLQLLHVLKC